MMSTQSRKEMGVVRKTSPPNCTIRNCPTGMMIIIRRKPVHSFKPLKAEPCDRKALALNIFQNCNMTKVVKNTDNS